MLDKSNLKTMSNTIRAGRQAKNLTREDLATKLGVPLSRVADWESYGRKNFQVPNHTMIRVLNEVLFDVQPTHRLVAENEAAAKYWGAEAPPKPVGLVDRLLNFFRRQ